MKHEVDHVVHFPSFCSYHCDCTPPAGWKVIPNCQKSCIYIASSKLSSGKFVDAINVSNSDILTDNDHLDNAAPINNQAHHLIVQTQIALQSAKGELCDAS